jgi:hypothetical protein
MIRHILHQTVLDVHLFHCASDSFFCLNNKIDGVHRSVETNFLAHASFKLGRTYLLVEQVKDTPAMIELELRL